MNEKNGFTLVELLAIIVIIGVLIGLIAPKLTGELKKSKEDAVNSTKEIVISVANEYIFDKNLSFPVSISIKTLCDNGYLNCDGDVLKIDDDNSLNGYIIANVKGEFYYSNTSISKEVTNMIVNGNFSNSDNWSIQDDTTYIISKNTYTGYTKTNFRNFIAQSININKDHKYYYSGYVNTNNNVFLGVVVFDTSNTFIGQSNITINKNNSLVKSSIIFKPGDISDNASYGYAVVQNLSNSSDEVMVSIKELVMVDLTLAFGVGNEPSIEWCDKNIQYFNGTTNIYIGD